MRKRMQIALIALGILFIFFVAIYYTLVLLLVQGIR